MGLDAAEVGTRTAGDDDVHEIQLAEGCIAGPEHLFFQARELREPKGKPGIVTERSEVAEMIRDALELETQGAQPGCARWQRNPRDAFQCLAISPR